MKTAAIILGVIVFLALALFSTYVGYYNYGNRTEKQIVASYENLQNVLSQYTLKVSEAAQVPAMMRDDLKEVYQAALQGRYGSNGSQAVMQWIREQNPNLSPELYIKIQQIIEAGRNEFQNNQTQFLDLKRTYETTLGSFWGSMWLGFAGYPKINLANYNIVKEDGAVQQFRSGTAVPLKLR